MAVLETVAEFIAPYAPRFEQTKMAELHASINKFILFGKPLDIDVATIRALAQAEFPKQDSLTEKVRSVSISSKFFLLIYVIFFFTATSLEASLFQGQKSNRNFCN